ncbi:MAG TPA: hypothetical protein VL651_13285 [Bacteroidia bacterium]|jgi:hypothetical protein|nr:hypothetical protein [Bacteroidia bacterium]
MKKLLPAFFLAFTCPVLHAQTDSVSETVSGNITITNYYFAGTSTLRKSEKEKTVYKVHHFRPSKGDTRKTIIHSHHTQWFPDGKCEWENHYCSRDNGKRIKGHSKEMEWDSTGKKLTCVFSRERTHNRLAGFDGPQPTLHTVEWEFRRDGRFVISRHASSQGNRD